MARTAKIQVYKYAELSEAAKQRAREWWRSRQDSHEPWSESVTEDLKTIATMMGWKISNTAFSGFSSQGDGAQFHGKWNACDVQDAFVLEQYAPAASNEGNARLARIMVGIAQLAKEAPESSASVCGVGRYSHSNATRFDNADLTAEQVDKLAEHSRALMDWYYHALEASYNEAMSDECVAERIEANEYEFKANGDVFKE